jgi:hypothetical protein
MSRGAQDLEAHRADVDVALNRLADAAGSRLLDPDQILTGAIGPGRVIPDDIVSVADLDLGLTEEQMIRLGREELASWLEMGSRFEAALNAGLSILILQTDDLTASQVRFLLHEIGEETRHQRAFIRVIEQLQPQARNPLRPAWLKPVERLLLSQLVGLPALIHVLVMAGEEVPDVFQKHTAEHPDTDPFVAAVNRYHRQEEARHLSYVRTVFPQVWASASALDRALVCHVVPLLLGQIGRVLVHPGVYATVGLPTWRTWRAANRAPSRQRLLIQAYRPILKMLVQAGVFDDGIPAGWRRLCDVRADGSPQAPRT